MLLTAKPFRVRLCLVLILARKPAAVCCACADACLLSPARDAAVITVAAINQEDEMPSFSDGGVCVDILGPGYQVLSAYYGSDSGTE